MSGAWLGLAALLLTTRCLSPPAAEAADDLSAEMASVLPITQLRGWMREAGVPGVSITVIKDFRIHWTLTAGVADQHSGRAVTPATLFQAASLSKPVTALATAVLAEQGKLDLDEDIGRYLRTWQLPRRAAKGGSVITPRMLLSHTSGLTDDLGFPGYRTDEPLPGLVNILNGTPPAKTAAVGAALPPMRQSRYSGGGSVVMQLLLMDLTQRSFPELMRLSLLEPLGMTPTVVDSTIPGEPIRSSPRRGSGAPRLISRFW